MPLAAYPLHKFFLAATASLCLAMPVIAQSSQPEAAAAGAPIVPQMMRFSGVAAERARDTVEVVFRIYTVREGGEPIWSETQHVSVDRDGNYSVLLGAATEGGLPQTVFAAGQARWLGISIERGPEQARAALASVAYAMKAADAETLGGLPASDFLTRRELGADSSVPGKDGLPGDRTGMAVHAAASPTGSGTANTIPLWTKASVLGNSLLTQSGTTVTAKGSVVAKSSSAAPAVTGANLAKTGVAAGVSGQVASTTNGSAAVEGASSALTGVVYGTTGSAKSTSPGASGIWGNESAKTGVVYGVVGSASSGSSLAAGVLGIESGPLGEVYGVWGRAASNQTNAAGVNGSESATTGQVYGVNGAASSTSAFAAGVNGFEGATTGEVYGVSGITNSATLNAAGINGFEGATTGQVYGVNGSTNSTTSYAAGVNGFNGATAGQVFGVTGSTSSTTANAAGVRGWEAALSGAVDGVWGGTNSTSNGASGVNGYAGGTSGAVYGVNGYAASSSTGAAGIYGYEASTSGFVYGVEGVTASDSGIGVYGTASATVGSGIGVQGSAASASGAGVVGSTSAAGGTAARFINSTGSGNLLVGISGSGSKQVFSVDANGNGTFAGNLNVTGTVSKGGGSFKIDDPIDPANKFLSHSFVESPDMMNVYNGNVITDKHGVATVTLPDYFEALNRDFRYQLTVIGQFAQAIVAKEIDKNHFVIRTNKPGVKVSWQVTGIRQDAYANAHRIPVEEDKQAGEQGYYLHPELFGQPESRNVAAAHSNTQAGATAPGSR